MPAKEQLLDDLNYLNIAEIRSFCKRHSIPFRIAVETKDGRRRMTRDDDRKGVMLQRLRYFLQTGVILGILGQIRSGILVRQSKQGGCPGLEEIAQAKGGKSHEAA